MTCGLCLTVVAVRVQCSPPGVLLLLQKLYNKLNTALLFHAYLLNTKIPQQDV